MGCLCATGREVWRRSTTIRGTQTVPVANPEALYTIGASLTRRGLGPPTEKYRTLGTLANVAVFNRLGTLPSWNFQASTFDTANQMSGETFHLTLQDTGGINLRFGNDAALLECLQCIGARRGIGDVLAQGSRRAAQRLRRGSGAWAMHVKGLEMPGYEPRSLKTMALGLAVSTRGACHNRSSAYEADFSARVDRLQAEVKRGRITMNVSIR